MMGDYMKRTLEGIERVEAQFKPQESWKPLSNVPERNFDGLVLLSQLGETKRVLHGLKPILEGHKPIHRELCRAVVHIETSMGEWWSPGMHNDEPVLARWREYFLESLLAVRWWTMVAALQAGEQFTGSKIYGNMLFLKSNGLEGVSQVNSRSSLNSFYERHFPSYGFEIWQQKRIVSVIDTLNDILQWKFVNILMADEHGATMALEAIRDADVPAFVIEGMPASYVDEAKSPLVEEVTMDLTRDVLGVSRAGSWVIRTKCQGVDCALKRMDDGGSEQPVIARLSHPHIVQLMHYWRNGKDLFLMMELMEGDLTDLFSRHKRANESVLSLPLAVDIMLQTAKGMLYLRDLDITYPQLSCSNVLFRKADTLQDGYIQYIIKLSGGGYCSKDDSSGRKTQDMYRFGLFCLEVLTGRQQYEDLLDIVANTRPSIPNTIPLTLKFCIASCFNGNLQFGFGQVVTLLLLAQYQVLKSQKDEAYLSFGSEDLETVQLNQPDWTFPSTSDADLEKYPIHQLYPEPDDSGSDSNPSATLIFFHGFAKNADEWKSTWMTRNREQIWPKEWLPKDLPGSVRILSLSYDNTDACGESQGFGAIEIGKDMLRQLVLGSKWNIADPERKVILIGHSFGGLIIKSLVVEAHNLAESQMTPTKKCQNFLENLKGIVFYSVPGSVTDEDQLFERYISKLNQTGVLQRSSLMQALLKDTKLFNQQMQVLGSQFKKNVPKKTKILGFIEGKAMRRVVVSDASARVQLENANFHILKEDNHFEVCRPVSADHKGSYKVLESFLKGILEIDSLNLGAEERKHRQSEDVPDVCYPGSSLNLGAGKRKRHQSEDVPVVEAEDVMPVRKRFLPRFKKFESIHEDSDHGGSIATENQLPEDNYMNVVGVEIAGHDTEPTPSVEDLDKYSYSFGSESSFGNREDSITKDLSMPHDIRSSTLGPSFRNSTLRHNIRAPAQDIRSSTLGHYIPAPADSSGVSESAGPAPQTYDNTWNFSSSPLVQNAPPSAGSSEVSESPGPTSQAYNNAWQFPATDPVEPPVPEACAASRVDVVPQSRFNGVRWKAKKWTSEIRPTGTKKTVWLGTYATEEEAASAFDAGIFYYGEPRNYNFPDSETYLPLLNRKMDERAQLNFIKTQARLIANQRAKLVGLQASVTMKNDHPIRFNPETPDTSSSGAGPAVSGSSMAEPSRFRASSV